MRIDELIDGGYMSYLEELTLNLFTNEVIVKSNMLHLGVEYWISAKIYPTNIITKDYQLLRERYTKLD